MKKKIAYFLCTIGGAGYLPLAPGTFASFIAVLIIFFYSPSQLILAMGILISSIIVISLTSEIEASDGIDPKHIVMDEFAGQWLTFLLIPNPSLIALSLGFFLFRFFDISKILGIDKLQQLKNGWGVLTDDLLAGLYANFLLQILLLTRIIT